MAAVLNSYNLDTKVGEQPPTQQYNGVSMYFPWHPRHEFKTKDNVDKSHKIVDKMPVNTEGNSRIKIFQFHANVKQE